MFKFLFEGASLLDLPLVVMLAFFTMFVAVVFWALSRRRTAHYSHMSQLPLADDRHMPHEEMQR